MEIHEYQAKEILTDFGVPIPRGGLAYSPEQAVYRSHEIGGDAWVVKAQIHSGGRGKAGGIKFCRDDDEIWKAADELLGRKLITNQTGSAGKIIHRLYVEEASEIANEYYIGFVLDRQKERIAIVASSEGGIEIEEIALERPESLIRVTVEPAVGMQPFQAREIAFKLGIDKSLISQAITTLLGCYRAFRDLDATMVEINPLVVTADNHLLALDAKMGFDDNALFRRPNISELRDKSQEDPPGNEGGGPRPQLRGPGWEYRLYYQRRGTRHGHHGHDQARRRRTGQFPGYRRRSLARSRGKSH